MNDEYFMRIALEEAKQAYLDDEIPVGVVIVKDNQIISKAHNTKENSNLITGHAEILALEQANKHKNDWRLNDCILYVTMQPCPMCAGAIFQSRIKKIVYGCDSSDPTHQKVFNLIYRSKNSDVSIVSGVLAEEASNIIKQFFNTKR